MRKIYQKTCFLWPVFYLINITNNLSHPGLFFFPEEKTFKTCYSDRTCSTSTNNTIAKDRCCCGNPGRSFGNCDKCPVKGEGNYIDKS